MQYSDNTKAIQDLDKLKHFKAKEFACKCCGLALMDDTLGPRLDKLRELLGKPIKLNSAYRCLKHNTAVGGAAGSYHMKGMAVDISMDNLDSMNLFTLVTEAVKLGFYGIELGHPKGMKVVHLDIRQPPGIIIFYPIPKGSV